MTSFLNGPNFSPLLSVSKGQVHEGLIHITNRGSVITWDFDVMRHDVVFTVFRLKSPLKIRSPSSTPTPTPTGQTTFTFPTKVGGGANPVVQGVCASIKKLVQWGFEYWAFFYPPSSGIASCVRIV